MEGNRAEKFLVEYFSHLLFQTFKDFEVVISDQSTFDNLRSIVDTFDHVLNIQYVRNTGEKKNAANNVNHAVKHAKGKIVKLLYMDDFFVDPFALQKISDAFDNNPEGKWFISGFTH
jgi:glycosyltransferase involved in cell wall biosynthesis